MQGALPTLGWVATSVLFGLVHIGPGRRFLPRTAWAIAMGFALGGIYEATGSLVGPLFAHVAINGLNLAYIARHDPTGPAPSAEPSLVGQTERR